MKNMKKMSAATVAGVAAFSLVGGAAGQVCDDLEGYTVGDGIVTDGDGTWDFWCDAIVDAFLDDSRAFSGVLSLKEVPGDDIVYMPPAATSGVFLMGAQTYADSAESGQSYVIGLNEYFDEFGFCAPTSWSLQVLMDLGTGIVTAQFSGNETTALIYDQWVEVKVIVDLDADTHDIFYGDTLLVDDRPWSGANGGTNIAVECIDIFNNNASAFWYDDIYAVAEQDFCFDTGGGEVCPDSQTILAGMQQSGGFGDVCASDDVRSVYQSTTFAAVFSPAPIQVQYDGNFAGAGAALTFNMEAHPTLGGGSAFLSVQMWNYTTGSYTSVPFINQADGTDTLYSLTVDNSGGDYVDTNGDVRALVTGAKTQDGPVRLNVDQVFWSD